MTRLIASCFVETVSGVDVFARRAWDSGADAVELRLDAFEDDPVTLAAYLAQHRDRFWIVTCRSAEEGGTFRGDTMHRVSMLLAAVRGTGAYVDFELADFERSSNVRQKIQLAAAQSGDAEPRLILSSHCLAGPPSDSEALIERFRRAHPTAIWKVAFSARTIEDSFLSLDLMRKYSPRLISIAMGECGFWTRVLAKKLGAYGSFASIERGEATAPGQLSIDELIGRYRWRAIDADTRVFGVVGDPVAHSMSPVLFNHWFAEAGVNAVYLPLRVSSGEESLERFLGGCVTRTWLQVGGFSVTLPHKQAALRWIGGGAESMARGIGAVNTLVFRDTGIGAYNTDCYAAVASLANALGCDRTDLKRFRFDVLGTGGAARGVIYGLRELGCAITVYARRSESSDIGISVIPWHEMQHRSGDVLVNGTPIGMWPGVAASPVPAAALDGCRHVFDMVYNPRETQLMRDARGRGVATLGGLDMFVRQAAMQFELWTGRSPNSESATKLLEAELERRRGCSP